MTGLKDRQRLALYVALGLSAGSGLTLDASTAYANPDNHVTVLSTDPDFSTKYASGVNATNETSSVKDNVVTIGRKSPVDTPAINGDVVGGYSNAYAVTHNTVTVDDMTLALAKSVFGGLADGDKAVDDNEVTINGGTFAGSNAVYGGKSDTGTATNNTVTIAGGTFSNANVAGGAASTGTTSNHNRVVLGSDHGVYTADLSQADIWGTRYSGDAVVTSGNAAITGNMLTVNAQNVTVNKVRNFEKYQFNLNQGVARDASMLTVADANGFGTGANVAWSNIEFSAKNWTDVKNGDGSHTHYGKSGVQTLIQTSDGNQHLVIHNETASSLTRTDLSGDFEYHLATDPPAAATVANGSVSVAKVTAEVNRIQNANAVYDAMGTRPADADNAVRGGYSAYGNTVKDNALRVTNLPTSGLDAAYGGEVAGLAGDVLKNTLTITSTLDRTPAPGGPHRETLTNAYGGAITNAGNNGTVGGLGENEGNRIMASGETTITNLYAGYTAGTGNVQGNLAAIGNGTVISKSYGGYSDHATGTGTVEHNGISVDGGTLTDVYGGGSAGSGAVKDNAVSLNGGTAVNAYGGFATGSAAVTENRVEVKGAEVNGEVYGAKAVSGAASGNEVFVRSGTVKQKVVGAETTTGKVSGSHVFVTGGTIGTPATHSAAAVLGRVMGAQSADGNVDGNSVTITGGTIVGTVHGGGATGSGNVTNNAVNLGNEDNHNLRNANLAAAKLIGSVKAAGTASGNALNVYAKNANVYTVSAFDTHHFILDRAITDGATMLSIAEGGFGQEIDWNSVVVENEPTMMKDGNPGGRVILAKGTASDKLKIAGYAKRDMSVDNIEHVVELENPTEPSTGHFEAEKLLLTYAKFRNNTWTYDGATPASANNEVFGGISYLKNDTTEKNELTVTGVPDAGLTAVYGGKTNGDANSKNNFVLVQGTDQYGSNPVVHSTIPNVYGGYTAANYRTETVDNKVVDKAGVAEGNNVILAKGNVGSLYGGKVEGEHGIAKNNIVVLTQEAEGIAGTVTQNTYGGVATGNASTATGNRAIITAGTAHDVYGGMVSGGVSTGTPNKVSTADGNVVQMIGGSAANVYGGDALNATDGTASHNKVSVTGGTVNGNIAGARAKYNATNAVSNGNTVTFGAEDGNHRPLGATFAAGTTVYGTNYQDASSDVTFDGNDTAVKGNTLNVNAKDVTVGTVRNFEKFNFNLGDTAKDGDVMLSLTQAGGFGTTSGSTSAPVQVDWTKVKADTSHLFTVRGQGAHGKNTITLMRETASTAAGDLLNFANYTVAAADYSGTDRDYETKMHTDNNAASTESVVLELNRFRNDSVLHDGTTQPDAVYGGYSAYDDTAVDANGDHLGHTTENNMLGITGVASGTNNLKAYGGYAGGDHGGAVNNHVNVNIQNTTPGVLDSVYGGYASGAHAGVVRGNTATLDSGIIADILAGGYADSTGADHNEVHINGGTVGTYIDPSTGSTVTHAAKVYGGYGATATDNTVEILAGTLTGNVYGGYATTAGTPATTGASPTAEVSALRNNKVTLRDGVTVTGNVYGAYAAADASNMTAATDSNTIDLYKAVIDGTLYGGMAQDGAGHDVVSGKNNTLAVHARGAKVDDFVGVQNLHFYVPAGTTAADKETMLTLDNVAAPAGAAAATPTTKDLSHVNVGVQLAGNRPSLKVGDAVSLMKVYKDNTTDATHAVAITSDTPLVNKATGMQGISLRYNFDLLTREAEAGSGKNNELYATVTSASVNPDTKSLAETRAASLAFLTSGSDLLTDAAMTAAMEVAATPASESQAGRARVDGAPKEYRMWAVQNVSSMRLNSGSHVDAKGWGLNLGFAKQRVSGRNTLTYGPFVEYGKGSYDSYLDDGLHGSGNMDYLGVGVMAKSQSENGAYVEGSVRVGRVKSDYAGTIDNTHTTYDSSSTYYAGHLGVGQEKQLKNGNTIETYAKYFFTHQGGDTAKLSTGEVYDFDAADSHRIRFGTRYTSKKGDASFYTGLAYEYEFGNDIAASFEGYNTPSPSLTGGTGILELGYRFTPQNGRATYGIQLMGMTGKRRGISGGVQMHWAF